MRLMLSDVIYSPVDVPSPYVDREKILAWHDARKVHCKEPGIKVIGYPWAISRPRCRTLGEKPGLIPGSSWEQSFVDEFPELVDVIEKYLPFAKIERINLLEQIKEVARHQDISKNPDPSVEPASYRFTLLNDEPERTFYLRRGVRWKGTLEQGDFFPKNPPETNWWVMNNLNSMHGSYMPTPGKRKLLLSIWGQVDKARHIDLLEKSVRKYKDYLFVDRPGKRPVKPYTQPRPEA